MVILKGMRYVRLFEGGRIYRQQIMVQWCPHLRSAISNIEELKSSCNLVILKSLKSIRGWADLSSTKYGAVVSSFAVSHF